MMFNTMKRKSVEKYKKGLGIKTDGVFNPQLYSET